MSYLVEGERYSDTNDLKCKYNASLKIIQDLTAHVIALEEGVTAKERVFVPSITEEEQELREMLL